MDMATPHSSLEDEVEQADKEEVVPEVEEDNVDAVGEQPKFPCLPCHTWEATNSYRTSREANNNL